MDMQEAKPKVEINESFGLFPKKVESFNLDLYRQSVKTLKQENREDVLPETTVIYENNQNHSQKEMSHLFLEQGFIGVYKHYALFKSVSLKEVFSTTSEGMSLINLKTMQQRMHYERVFQSLQSSETLEREATLFPEKINFSKTGAKIILGQVQSLLKLGIEVRLFGEETFVIESLSPLYSISDVKDFLFEMSSSSSFEGESLTLETKKKLAQRAAYLATSEARYRDKVSVLALIKAFLSLQNVEYSFKGEPILITLVDYDIEKLFRK